MAISGGLYRSIARQEVHSVPREREREPIPTSFHRIPAVGSRASFFCRASIFPNGTCKSPTFSSSFLKYVRESRKHLYRNRGKYILTLLNVFHGLFTCLCNPRGSCGRYPNETPWIFISMRSVLVKHRSPTLERTERKSLSKMRPKSEIMQQNTHPINIFKKPTNPWTRVHLSKPVSGGGSGNLSTSCRA